MSFIQRSVPYFEAFSKELGIQVKNYEICCVTLNYCMYVLMRENFNITAFTFKLVSAMLRSGVETLNGVALQEC
jgi:uncharacterized protein YmfQ (DUF2313 family)